jgi:hypothetical protein
VTAVHGVPGGRGPDAPAPETGGPILRKHL